MRFKRALISAAAFGTVALAGGAWAPAAMAQPTAATAPTLTRAALTQPATVKKCNSSTKNWAALYPTFGDWLEGQLAVYCIGNKGTFDVPHNDVQIFCAGNNNGTFWFHDYSTGTNGSGAFRYDNTYEVVDGKVKGAYLPDSDVIDVTKVQITGWTGSAGC